MAPEISTARRNGVLNGLPDAELAAMLPDLDEVPLRLGDIIYQARQPVPAVFFPTLGVISILVDLRGGDNVEVASVGRDGMAGLSVFLGAGAPTEQARVQVAGSALRMATEQFRQAVAVVDGPLPAMLRRYTQAMFTQIARNAACNRVHTVRQRAARWLLMTADRMDGPSFDLTQEFLAQMLAVRRASVSDVAQGLAEDGCIAYTRGAITILDRRRLQANACECYQVISTATASIQQ